MFKRPVRLPPVQSEVVVLEGGLNENISSLELRGGELISSFNYMIREGSYGGYTRIPGFERYDGTTLPSEYESYIITLENCSVELEDTDSISGATSGATATIVGAPALISGTYTSGDAVVVVEALIGAGTFEAGEDIETTEVVGTLRYVDSQVGGSEDHHEALDYHRSLIAAVPGSGNIIGLHLYRGTLYAFRNHTDGLTAKMWAATSSGWIEVSTAEEPLAPSGTKFKAINYNFYATVGSSSEPNQMMYWVDGVNQCRSFDGTTVVTIDNVGMSGHTSGDIDTPLNIAAINNRLFLAYAGGSLQYSTLGDPEDWITSSGEIGLGKEIVDLITSVGNSLIIFCNEAIKILTGQTPDDWVLETFSETSSASYNTVKDFLGTVYFLDDFGVTSLQGVDAFGGFKASTIDYKVRRTIEAYKGLVTTACVSKDKNQYRLFFSNDYGLYFSFLQNKLRGISLVKFDRPVLKVTEGMNASDEYCIFFSSEDGYVYKMDSGTSFDGEEIESLIVTPYYGYKSPRLWKSFKRITFEIYSENEVEFRVDFKFDYGQPEYPRSISYTKDTYPVGGRWDVGLWDVMLYSGGEIDRQPLYIHGIGTNMSVRLYTSSAFYRPYTIQNFITDFTINRRQV